MIGIKLDFLNEPEDIRTGTPIEAPPTRPVTVDSPVIYEVLTELTATDPTSITPALVAGSTSTDPIQTISPAVDLVHTGARSSTTINPIQEVGN